MIYDDDQTPFGSGRRGDGDRAVGCRPGCRAESQNRDHLSVADRRRRLAHELDVGREAIAKELGDKVEFIKAENLPEGPDAARIINQMAGENPKLMILGSFGYMNDGLKLAARRSDIDFIHASGYKTAPNFVGFCRATTRARMWRAWRPGM